MELNEIRHLCTLSRLSYDGEELQKVMEEMTEIVALMDTIKTFDLTYDDTMDNNSIPFSEVREDVPQPSLPREKLLSNAESTEGCYVVPKVVE